MWLCVVNNNIQEKKIHWRQNNNFNHPPLWVLFFSLYIIIFSYIQHTTYTHQHVRRNKNNNFLWNRNKNKIRCLKDKAYTKYFFPRGSTLCFLNFLYIILFPVYYYKYNTKKEDYSVFFKFPVYYFIIYNTHIHINMWELKIIFRNII